jgi:alpha-galactosidase
MDGVHIAWNADLPLTIEDDQPVRLGAVNLVELSLDGAGRTTASSDQHRNYATSARLRYVRHEIADNSLTVVQRDPSTGVEVDSRLTKYPTAISAVTTVRNTGSEPHRIDYVSSLNIATTADSVHIPYNTWFAEFRWRTLSTADIGFVDTGLKPGSIAGRNRYAVDAFGSWSTGNNLPMGALTGNGRTLLWQIEHNGAWHWELTDLGGDLQVTVSGPTEAEHQCAIELAPGDEFGSVPVSLVISSDGLTGVLADVNEYRRAIRRPNRDNAELPVIFNDYMNCLMGDPTTEKLLPLIDAAADVGAEYFVIDAGWYSETDNWWPTVGEWQPSTRRFPNGLKEVTDRIHKNGMVPGLWVEPEVVGVESPVADRLPDEAFFRRHGRRLAEAGRYQLDYRHPAVIEYMDSVIDRLVADFGVGYFKFDYNINIGPGTGESPGAGLLGHNRAFSAWLDGLFARHPDLVIENCSSGGMRVDYSQLRRMSIQSTSDQQDPLRYVPIAAAAPSAVTPEQAAIWAYSQPSYADELNVLTLVNAMLGRIHLSGHIDLMTGPQQDLVRRAITAYKGIRAGIPTARPVWPLGLPGWDDPWIALALENSTETLVAVWRRGGADAVDIPLNGARVESVFQGDAEFEWTPGTLRVKLPDPGAAIFCCKR